MRLPMGQRPVLPLPRMALMYTAIIPAHNEADGIDATIASLRAQTVPPTRILVAADNCTDDTATIAKSLGCDVWETIDNTGRKAGALNQALNLIDTDLVLVMDADTQLVPRFAEVALDRLHIPVVGAVGAVFQGDPSGPLEMCQSLEWQRYGRELTRTGRVWVLSGTAAMIRTEALEQVRAARIDGQLPGAGIYKADAATEDMELSIALKSLGWRLESPLECVSTTEIMPTVPTLWRQRLRWYGGALECLAAYGLTRTTWRYWGQQIMLGIGTLSMALLILLTVTDAALGMVGWSPFWSAIGAIFWAERIATVKGARARLFAALLIPELLYALTLQACWLVALTRHALGRRIVWTHLQPN